MPSASTSRRRTWTTRPSARIRRPIGTGRLNSTLMRAVTPHMSWSTSAHAMTSSRIVHTTPPCAMSSQPWNRSGRTSSVQQRSSPACSSSPMPWTLSVPQAKQLWGSMTIREPPIRTSERLTGASDVKVAHLAGLGLDEVLAGLHPLAHQHREDLVRDGRVLDLHFEQRPGLRVHRRVPELVGVHLAQTLEALDAQVPGGELLDLLVAFLLGLGVLRDLAGGDPVQRRLRDVGEAGVHDLRHVPVEEGQQQGPDVAVYYTHLTLP